jgi:Leucine-rich repeat (LRR) protein
MQLNLNQKKMEELPNEIIEKILSFHRCLNTMENIKINKFLYTIKYIIDKKNIDIIENENDLLKPINGYFKFDNSLFESEFLAFYFKNTVNLNVLLYLINLKRLVLYSCEINELPNNISDLKHLEALFLYNNNLVKLPDSFCNLKHLKILDLSNNKLETLPDDFGNLCLIDLNLSGNKIVSLPKSFNKLNSLENFNI